MPYGISNGTYNGITPTQEITGSGGGANINQNVGNDGGGVVITSGIGSSTYANTAIRQEINRTHNNPDIMRFMKSAQWGGNQPLPVPDTVSNSLNRAPLGRLPTDLYQHCLPSTSQCTDQGRDLFPTLEKSGGNLVRENGYGNGRGYVYDVAVHNSDVKDTIPFPNPNRKWRFGAVNPVLDAQGRAGHRWKR